MANPQSATASSSSTGVVSDATFDHGVSRPAREALIVQAAGAESSTAPAVVGATPDSADCHILLNFPIDPRPSSVTLHLTTPDLAVGPMAAATSNPVSAHQTQLALAEFFGQHPVLKSFLAGSLSGTASTLLFQPFDLVKTRIQNANFALSSPSGVVQVPNRIVPILYNVVKNEQLIGLWRGTLPSLMRCVPGVGLHFCCLDTLQSHFCDGRKPTAGEAFVFGSVSRSLAGVLLIPVTVIKTRYESGVFVYKSLADAVRHTYRSEGARGLTSGLLPTLARDVPFSGLYYMFYSQLKSLTSPLVERNDQVGKKPGLLTSSAVTFLCGMNAGLMASVVTQPMDVVKTHMQLYPKQFPSSIQTVIMIVRKKGPQGLFAGLVPRMLRRTLVASMTWTVFEQMMAQLGLK